MYVSFVIRAIATTAVLLRTTLQCDCNPSLYLTDLWFRYTSFCSLPKRRRRLQQQQQQQHPFQNQCIWIIGASSGIGEELAYQLVSPIHSRRSTTGSTSSTSSSNKKQQGQSPQSDHPIHLILSSRSVDRLQKVGTTCQSYNPNCTITVLPFDVTKDDDIHTAIEQLRILSSSTGSTAVTQQNTNTATTTTTTNNSTIGLIDTVIFNAGIGHLSPAIETSSTTIDQIWKQTARYPMIIIPLLLLLSRFNDHTLNLNHPTYTVPILKHIDRPHFVITSSIAAMIPVPLSSVYGAAKAALWNYSRTLQCEYPNLLLHTIMPGPVDTNFHQQPTTNVRNNNNININNNMNPKIEITPLLPEQQPSLPKSKTMKMSVHRCVQLIISTMRLSYSTECWMVPSSSLPLSLLVLIGLYLHKLLPFALLHNMIYSKIGPQRIRMWRNGYDLYDPKSWRK